jgi:hypothetical protein
MQPRIGMKGHTNGRFLHQSLFQSVASQRQSTWVISKGLDVRNLKLCWYFDVANIYILKSA